MNKVFYPLLPALMIGCASVNAQTPVSPMQDLEGKTVHQSKVFSFFEQYNTNNSTSDLYSAYARQNNNTFDSSGLVIASPAAGIPLGAHLGAAAGDFNNDGFDDAVTVVLNRNHKPYVTVTITDTAAMRAATTFSFEINNLASDITTLQNRVCLAAGNFTGSGSDDFVLGFVDSTTQQLVLKWYTVVNGTSATQVASRTVPKDSTGTTQVSLGYVLNSFHMVSGDFDHDGNDELAVAYLAPGTTNQQYITYFHIAVFDLSGGQMVFKGNRLVVNNSDAVHCSLAAGNLSGTNKDDLAFAISSGSGSTRVGLVSVDMTQGYNGVVTAVGTPLNIFGFQGQSYIPSLAAGDLNGDGTDEVVLADGREVKVIRVTNPGMTYSNAWIGQTAAASGTITYPNSGLAVADVDRDGKAEIFIMGSESTTNTERFILDMIRVPASLYPWTNVAAKTIYTWDNTYFQFPSNGQYPARRYAFVPGDFDGKTFTVGTGTMYFKPNIVQPLVILNTPPVHFDILDSTQYDVNKCYQGSACDFKSIYNTSNNTQINVTTTINQDWSVSARLSAGGNFGIVDVGGYMGAKYGEKYSNVSGSSTTVNISTQVVATDDDYIYAMVNNFYVWEYPIYRKGQFMGHILSVTPVNVDNQWFPSKSWSALSYIPNHEVGCILSYKDYPSFQDNPDLQERIKASYTGNSFLLNGSNNTFDWSLNYTDVTSNSASTQKDINVEVGGEVGTYGIKLEVSGTYDQSSISSYTSTVTNNLLIQAHMGGGLNASIGEVNYTVTPYTYWANNGALVLDYAATPELPVNNGGTPTWWSAKYTKQDPAFIMPWRYDPEKGYTLQDPRKRRQSKSITMFPDSASTGDTIKLRAIIHNFGLLPSDSGIKVRFYVGDPYYQNVITDIHGVSDFYLQRIQMRDRQILEIDWKVPAGIYRFPKIYASIDPDNTLDEIHRNNNIGWNLFTVRDGSNFDPDTIVNSINPVEAAVKQFEIYPNPANDAATVISADESVIGGTLSVADITGRVIYKNTVQGLTTTINCAEWSNGIYFATLRKNAYVSSKKILINR